MSIKGKDIAHVRTMTTLTQEEFSRKIGVSLGTLRRWEQAPTASISGIIREKFGRWAKRQPPGKLPKKYLQPSL